MQPGSRPRPTPAAGGSQPGGRRRAAASRRGRARRWVGLLVAPLLLVIASGCASPPPVAGCAGAIGWREAESRVGTWSVVRGPVVDAHFASEGEGQPTFLDVGRVYPDPTRFSVVIWGRDRAQFPVPPDQAFRGRTVCVSGLVDTASGSVGIEVTDRSAIVAL